MTTSKKAIGLQTKVQRFVILYGHSNTEWGWAIFLLTIIVLKVGTWAVIYPNYKTNMNQQYNCSLLHSETGVCNAPIVLEQTETSFISNNLWHGFFCTHHHITDYCDNFSDDNRIPTPLIEYTNNQFKLKNTIL